MEHPAISERAGACNHAPGFFLAAGLARRTKSIRTGIPVIMAGAAISSAIGACRADSSGTSWRNETTSPP